MQRTRSGPFPKIPPAERRELVARGVEAGKSQRAMAKELGVDEITIRRDLKLLGIQPNKKPTLTRTRRPSSALVPGASEVAPTVNPQDFARPVSKLHFVRGNVTLPPKPVPRSQPKQQELQTDRERRVSKMLPLLDGWLVEQRLGTWSTQVVLNEAVILLEGGEETISNLPAPSLSPAELILATGPDGIDSQNPDNVRKYEEERALWLARWLAAALPREKHVRDELLSRIRTQLRTR
jgi:transposase-like protein